MNKKQAAEYLLSKMSNGRILDVTPDTILHNKLDPKIKESCKVLNYSITGNGLLLDNAEKGFIPELMESMYKERKFAKKTMLEYESLIEAINTELNSRKKES